MHATIHECCCMFLSLHLLVIYLLLYSFLYFFLRFRHFCFVVFCCGSCSYTETDSTMSNGNAESLIEAARFGDLPSLQARVEAGAKVNENDKVSTCSNSRQQAAKAINQPSILPKPSATHSLPPSLCVAHLLSSSTLVSQVMTAHLSYMFCIIWLLLSSPL